MSGDDRMADPDAVEMQATMQQQPPHEPQDLNASLRKHFGHDRFRPGQEAVVRSVLSGQPTLAILPTGGGKSLCYQLPALLLPGTTVVASPLVALMKDQVDALVARGIPATFINSSIGESERQERQARLRRGELKIVYVAPERFRSSSFLNSIAQIKVPLLAVDEAHCISSWGHDFRPDYAQLQRSRETIRAERILALTATATAEVRTDIAQALGLLNPRVFVAGFDRPNLFLESTRVTGDADKLARLTALSRASSPGLVYAATRRNVEKVVVALRARGIDAIGYHAGMDDAARTRSQDKFVRNECEVIVATNAFGMGVDKPDIRFVAHFDVPRTVEAWYQEIGRAGRDGKDSLALLLFNFADVKLQQRLIDGGRASESVVRAALAGARRLGSGSLDALERATGLSAQELQPALRVLESAGHLERGRGWGDGAEFAAARSNGAAGPDLGIDFAMLEKRVMRERRMLDRMVRLVDSRGCRRHELLRYFGDPEAPARCAACDNCVGARAPAPSAAEALTTARDRSRRGESRDGLHATNRAAATESDEPVDPALFEALRALRTELARAAATPPYVIFHDSTLRALCRERPASREAFLRVKGAGPARWDRYGERVLEVIGKAGTASSDAAPVPGGRAPTQPALAPARSLATAQPERAHVQQSGPSRSSSASASHAQQASRPAPRDPDLDSVQWAVDDPRPPRASETLPGWLSAGPRLDLQADPRLSSAPESPVASRVLALARSGRTLAEIALSLGAPAAEVASELASLAARGSDLDVTRLLGPERFAAIRASAAGCDGDLVAVRRRLAFPAALGEIRLALLDPTSSNLPTP